MNEQAEETAVVVVEEEDLSLQEYGRREDVRLLAKRIKTLMPGGEKLTDFQAMTAAQYAILMDLNPFRGEMYVYEDDKKEVHLVDGYKALVRWAKDECAYSEKYEPLEGEGLGKDDIGYTCYVLREDAIPLLKQLIDAGIPPMEAFKIAAASAVGVVTKREMWSSKYNGPIPPPKGWTWDEVARKRSLKNTLNRSHGAPSPGEAARQSWVVNGRQTIPEDWETVTPEMTSFQREAEAGFNAMAREAHEAAQEAMENGTTAEDAVAELFDVETGEIPFPEEGEDWVEGTEEEVDPYDIPVTQETIDALKRAVRAAWPKYKGMVLSDSMLAEKLAAVLNRGDLKETKDIHAITEGEAELVLALCTHMSLVEEDDQAAEYAKLADKVRLLASERKPWTDEAMVEQPELPGMEE